MYQHLLVVRSVLAVLILGFFVEVAAAAEPLAAIPSSRAEHSLLLDVARAGTRLVAVGERGHIVFSDDQGRTWHQAKVPTRVLLTAVFFPTAADGWAVGHDGTILHSSDGGVSWSLQRTQVFDPDAAAQAEADTLAAAEVAGIDIASDEGTEAGAAAAARVGAALLDVWFADALHGYVVGSNGTFMETTNGGAVWDDRSARLDNPDSWHINAIAVQPANPQVLILAGEKGTLYRSTDDGQHFVRVRLAHEGSYFGVLATAREIYLFGLQGRIFHSPDGGGSWSPLESGVTSGLNDAVALANGTVAIAGNAGVVVTIAPDAVRPVTVHRADRKVVASLIDIDDGLLLVGEAGAKRARRNGEQP